MKGIIFDIDGTLLDSTKMWEHIPGDYLTSVGIPVPEDIFGNIDTLTIRGVAEWFATGLGVDDTADNITKAINNMVIDKYAYEIELKPFAREYIEKQKSLGVKMSCLTASEIDYIEPALKRLGIWDLFEFVDTCTKIGADKRDIKSFDIVAKKMNLKSDEVVVFEDSIYALKTAKSGGYCTVGVYDEYSKDYLEEIKKYSDKFIMDYGELL